MRYDFWGKGRDVTDELFEQNIVRIQQGEREGLKQIYEAYIAFIYSVVYDILKNKEGAEDVTSEFFIKLWKIADQYKFGGKHKAYLATIAHNMAIDYIRKNRREQVVDEIQDMADAGQSAATTLSTKPESVEDSVVSNITMKEAISTLKEKEQQILNMKIFGELTFQEIADILQTPMGTVTWRYQTAIGKLRKTLHNAGEEVWQ